MGAVETARSAACPPRGHMDAVPLLGQQDAQVRLLASHPPPVGRYEGHVAPDEGVAAFLITEYMFRLRTGWPLRSLAGVAWTRDYQVYIYEAALPTRWHPRTPWLVYRPLWLGFAVNTVFYMTILATLWLLIRVGYFYAFRRVIRVRRGLCPKCAYPMGESDVCSECGKALPKQANATT